MNEILNSKVFRDFQNGKLPTVEVSIKGETLATLFGGLFVTLIAVIILFNILKKIG